MSSRSTRYGHAAIERYRGHHGCIGTVPHVPPVLLQRGDGRTDVCAPGLVLH